MCKVSVAVGEVLEGSACDVTDNTHWCLEDIRNMVDKVSAEWEADNFGFERIANVLSVKQGMIDVAALVENMETSVLAPGNTVAAHTVEYMGTLAERSHEAEGAGWDVAKGLAPVPDGVSGVERLDGKPVLLCQPKDPVTQWVDHLTVASQEQEAI